MKIVIEKSLTYSEYEGQPSVESHSNMTVEGTQDDCMMFVLRTGAMTLADLNETARTMMEAMKLEDLSA